ncbi:MAG: urease accessory protein [Alteromonadaceae bacterium]|nr:MAG: urease accessory protein [Alteromonadaceae bacterium]
MLIEFTPLLLVGFGLGMIHALDADHIMAIAALNNQKPAFRRTITHSAHWALGHGSVLLISGALLFGLGIAMPQSMQKLAENAVGIVLIGLGLSFFWQFSREKKQAPIKNPGVHKPLLIGILHGLAGSASALALLPALAQNEHLQAIIYLLIFSLGVMLGMLFFGLIFAYLQRFMSQHYFRTFQGTRQVLALLSIALGSFWLYQSV